MKRASTLLMAILFLAPPVSAQEAAEWAVKLGSRNYAEREKAGRALEQLGKTALPALRAVLGNADLETKRRAILIMERIEDRLMQDELATALPVRLRFQNLPLDETLSEIEKQIDLRSGNVIRRDPISVDTGVLPYWQAWRRFCSATRLEESDPARSAAKLKRMNENDVDQLLKMLDRTGVDRRYPAWAPRMEFGASPSPSRYAVDDRHSVRVRIKWQGMDRVIDEKKAHAVFAVELRAEPRLELASTPKVEITKIVDDQGQVHLVQEAKMFPAADSLQNAEFLAGYVGEIQSGGFLQLKAIPWQGPTRSLKEVQGRVRMNVTVRPRMMEMPDVLKAVGKQMRGFEGVTVKILEAEATDEGEVQLRLRLDHLESLVPQEPEKQIVRVRPGVIAVRGPMDFALERLYLLDSTGRKGRQIKVRYEHTPDGKGYEAELVFALPGDQADNLTLVMTKAPRTVPLEIPFLVRDLVWTEKQEAK